ncbi:unnamed protein product, partial [Pneumocystis jirovecii]
LKLIRNRFKCTDLSVHLNQVKYIVLVDLKFLFQAKYIFLIGSVDFGLIGLAVMGQNLVLNAADKGFVNRIFCSLRAINLVNLDSYRQFVGSQLLYSIEQYQKLINFWKMRLKPIVGAHSIEEFCSFLKHPRCIMLLVKAGEPVDQFIELLLPYIEKGDIIIDGGNSYFVDTNTRYERLKAKGILFVGTGISGGEEGARHGPSIMPGGNSDAWKHIKHIFQTIAAYSDDKPCCDWVGESGAGHYVKMVHNGVEYGDMQLISEAYDLMRRGLEMSNQEIGDIFEQWNKGVLNSFLIEITCNIFRYKDDNDEYIIDRIMDSAGQKGTGKWTAISAFDLGVPATLISEAVFSRFLSNMQEERINVSKKFQRLNTKYTGNKKEFICHLEQALYASKIISYTQGFMLMKHAATNYNWKLDNSSIAHMWQGGCIIRSVFLKEISKAYLESPELENLLLKPFFHNAILTAEPSWRKIVASAAEMGIPTPAFSTALSFFDGYRSEHLPSNLIQAQRDYFEMPVKPSDKLGNSWNHDSFSEICLKTDFFRSSVEECCALLHTSWKTGLLTHEDILYRQSIYGINKTTIESNESLFFRFFKQLTDNFLMMLLLISALISLFVGNVNDAVSAHNVGFLQEYHSEKSLKALNNMVSYNCHVIRNGENQYIAASELVPGDLIKFSIGDRIPADLRITEAIDLELDESNLTGETNAVCKNTDALREDRLVVPISEQRCIGFMGTLIKSPRTPLQKSMDELGKQLSLFSIIVIVIISLTGLLQGRSWLEMSTITISLAVAAVPEGLPIIVSVTLALGVHRMANKKAIVKNLPSVETLGSVNIMCCDKTGTLTENHMTIQKIFTLGEDGLIDISSDLKKPLFTNDKTLKCLLNIANLCNNARKSNNRKFIGQSVDVAIMELIERYGYNDNRMVILMLLSNIFNNKQVYTRTQEIPFSSNRKWMSVTAYPSSMTPSLSSVYVKGSYEEIRMKSVSALEKNAIEIPLTKDIIEKFDRVALNMASEGLRVIALASLSSSSNQGLTIAGLIGLHDPLKKDIKESIQRLLQNSIRVVIITGDSEATALSTAYNIGIPIQYPKSHKINQGYQQFENVISGNSFEKMTNKQLSEAISNINIFARTTPRHKMKIIEAFQTRGNIVAMIGDGVNDAPALKLANIGIAMGKYGTDVAREAADMILTDDSFSTILNAIEEGKGIYHNISAFITFQLSTSIAALSLVSFAVIFVLHTYFLTKKLIIDILMDGPPAQSLSCESIHSNVISNHPREKNTPLLTTALLKKVFISAFLIVFGTFFIYIFEINRSTERKSTTMAFTCFVFFDIFNVLTCRSNTKSIFNIGFFSNHMFNLAILGSFLGQISVIYIPFFQRIFHTESLSLSDLLFLIVVTSSIFWADELRKLKTQKNIVKESFIA